MPDTFLYLSQYLVSATTRMTKLCTIYIKTVIVHYDVHCVIMTSNTKISVLERSYRKSITHYTLLIVNVYHTS